MCDIRQTWIQKIALEYRQQDPSVLFQVDDLLDEINAREFKDVGYAKVAINFDFKSDGRSGITELTVSSSVIDQHRRSLHEGKAVNDDIFLPHHRIHSGYLV
jgi:hypothetical protein